MTSILNKTPLISPVVCAFLLIATSACSQQPAVDNAGNGGPVAPIPTLQNPADNKSPQLAATASSRILQKAQAWIGRDYRAGSSAQCANFVRQVLSEACNQDFINDGKNVLQAAQPWDAERVRAIMGNSFGPGFADSLAGTEIGKRVSLSSLQAGDLVFFERTYGNYGRGVITHVGIYAGKGTIIDRSTVAEPVRQRSINSALFYAGLRIQPGLCQ